MTRNTQKLRRKDEDERWIGEGEEEGEER